MNQKTALEVLKLGYNIYLTGPAGSGKTFLLNEYIKYLRNKDIEVAVTASTGIAATHMNGITIHSWSNMGIKNEISNSDLLKLYRKPVYQKRFKKTKVLIIDEISMLHAHQLDIVDKICRFMKSEPFIPFGGLQVVLCGDFFQLPPVTKGLEKAKLVYNSEAWEKMKVRICYLEEQKRQTDSEMIRVLNDIRNQTVDNETAKIVLMREHEEIEGDIKPTRIFTHNRDVDLINNEELEKIKEKPFSYSMLLEGNKVLRDILKNGCLAPEKLVLKKGAVVMFVKNNFEKGYVNGTVGKIAGFDSETKLPIVKTSSGEGVLAEPARWEFEEGGEIKAWIKQIPLRLAWAITVHKSQGMTIDAAEMDLGRSFEYGMGYVALSRVRSLSGLKLLDINEMAFEVDPEVVEFDKELIRMSKEIEKEVMEMNWFERFKKQRKFLSSARKK
jgi:hypothetical protein